MPYTISISLWYNSGDEVGALALPEAPQLGAAPHAQKVMQYFGIEYEEAQPMPIADCWVFRGCKSHPGTVPSWMTVREEAI